MEIPEYVVICVLVLSLTVGALLICWSARSMRRIQRQPTRIVLSGNQPTIVCHLFQADAGDVLTSTSTVVWDRSNMKHLNLFEWSMQPPQPGLVDILQRCMGLTELTKIVLAFTDRVIQRNQTILRCPSHLDGQNGVIQVFPDSTVIFSSWTQLAICKQDQAIVHNLADQRGHIGLGAYGRQTRNPVNLFWFEDPSEGSAESRIHIMTLHEHKAPSFQLVERKTMRTHQCVQMDNQQGRIPTWVFVNDGIVRWQPVGPSSVVECCAGDGTVVLSQHGTHCPLSEWKSPFARQPIDLFIDGPGNVWIISYPDNMGRYTVLSRKQERVWFMEFPLLPRATERHQLWLNRGPNGDVLWTTEIVSTAYRSASYLVARNVDLPF